MLDLGYRIVDIEFLGVLGVAVALALLVAPGARLNTLFRVATTSAAAFLITQTYLVRVVDPLLSGYLLVAIASICWLFRTHVVLILGAGCLAMLGSSAAIGLVRGLQLQPPPQSYAGTVDRPSVVHLILDEHGGPGSLPSDMFSPEEIGRATASFSRHGFRLFTNARSTQRWTQESLASAMNGDVTPPEGSLLHGRPEHRMTRNRYLERFVDSGYRARVIQTSFLDLCSRRVRQGGNCFSYPHYTAGVLHDLDLPAGDRALVLASLADRALRTTYRNFLYQTFRDSDNGAAFGRWLRKHAQWRLQGLVSARVLPFIADELAALPRGVVYVAHLLLPHHPYVFDGQCRVTPMSTWIEPDFLLTPYTASLRAARYRLYYEQMLCTNDMLGELISVIDGNPALRDATVIVHGDHGSRLAPTVYSQLSTSYDQASYDSDWLGTLFAVRKPGWDAGLDDRQANLTELLWMAIDAADTLPGSQPLAESTGPAGTANAAN